MALFPPVLQGRMAFQHFANSVKLDLRYFRSVEAEKFLADVLASCHARKQEVPKGFRWWRARLGGLWEEDVIIAETEGCSIIGPAEMPFPVGEMKPLPVNWNSEGRVNPRGISYLYLATNQDTALAEVRPWIGSMVSVGEFSAVRDLAIIDCSIYHTGMPAFPASREDGMWSAVDQAFAKPVGKHEESSDYIPTQILGELFKSAGYDGVAYKSLLDDEGINMVLFNSDNADLVSCSLFKVESVKFRCVDQKRTYYSQGG